MPRTKQQTVTRSTPDVAQYTNSTTRAAQFEAQRRVDSYMPLGRACEANVTAVQSQEGSRPSGQLVGGGLGRLRGPRKVKRAKKAATKKPVDLRMLSQRVFAEQRATDFARDCHRDGIPPATREYQFAAPDRKWALDFAWPDHRVALEVEGAVWTGGRHTRGAGFLADVEKYNAAAVRGWLVFRCTPQTLNVPATRNMIRLALRRSPRAELTITPL